jgi:glycosyltransferase involved in cell wall biosynthesis
MKLSVVIPVLNDPVEIVSTIRSIKDTASSVFEVIVVDDASDQPVILPWNDVKIVRNTQRMGVSWSRDLGASIATGDVMLITDSHMRFTPSWYPKITEYFKNRGMDTAYCASCLGLDANHMDLSCHLGAYHGATVSFYSQEHNEIFEGKWIPARSHFDDYPLGCFMGACYFVPLAWFRKVRGLGMLKMWGSEEPYLSLKLWLAGCNIRYARDVQIGHKFRTLAPYQTDSWNLVYNKIRAMQEILPADVAEWLTSKFHRGVVFDQAISKVKEDAALIKEAREYYSSIFIKKRTLAWYCDLFRIPMPWAEK